MGDCFLHTCECCPPSTIEEARQCILFVANFDADGKEQGRGSAFVVEEEGVQWIYTNAHVIEGATRIEFNDQEGNPVTGFGRFSCYASGSGDIDITPKGSREKQVARFGGDGVRLELKYKRKIALEISSDSSVIKNKAKVVTLGDNDGDRILETLEGEITSSTPKVILSTCKTRPGCSGGALLDAATLKVVGLHTLGIPSTLKPLDSLWKMKDDEPEKAEEKSAGASILHNVEWIDLPAGEFLKGSQSQQEFLNTVAILTLIYQTTPTESGFAINMSALFAGGLTYGDAFGTYKADRILGPVLDLNEKLGRARGSSLKVNNMEIVSTYSKAITNIRAEYLKETERLMKKTPPYYRFKLEANGWIDLGSKCHEGLANAESWFSEKAGAGGIMPLGRWVHLPPLSGFSE